MGGILPTGGTGLGLFESQQTSEESIAEINDYLVSISPTPSPVVDLGLSPDSDLGFNFGAGSVAHRFESFDNAGVAISGLNSVNTAAAAILGAASSPDSSIGLQLSSSVAGGRGSPATRPPSHTQPDRRVRIVPKDKGVLTGYLTPLKDTSGALLFPFTPTIQINRIAEWNPYDLVHTNYRTQTYSKSYVDDIVISCQFTADTEETAAYAFAAAHFFKTMMQMHFGRTDQNRGAPPPVLELYGHGEDIFNAVPVVIKSFSQEYNDTVDMVKVPTGGIDAWVPIVQTFIVTLGVTHNMLKVREEFNVDYFKEGSLVKRGYL